MTTPLNTVLTYNAIDLTPYEIRGAKSGINNAYSTGPVYDGSQYYPSKSVVGAYGLLNGTDSTVRSLTGITTFSLNAGKDSALIDNISYKVTGLLSMDSFGLDSIPTLVGNYPITFLLGQRDYVIEPDSVSNTFLGQASFVSGSYTVDGTGTSWSTDLTSGDFIKADYYQQFYKIDHTTSNTSLVLTSPFGGDTSSSTFTAKKWAIGQTEIQYSKNDITFDNKSGRWKYDATTGSQVPTSLNLSPLNPVDGLELAFTKSIAQNAPDLMDIATVVNKTFSRSTQYDTFQFSLPVVPYPEETLSLSINNIPKIRNVDYAVNYTQMPMYSPPQPPAQRFVANLMFLKGLDYIPSTALTETGHFPVVDASGTVYTEVLPGSEYLTVAGIDQTVYKDYVLEPNAGAFDTIDSTVNEPIVKYVMTDYSDIVDHGFSIDLNGTPQQISYPAQTSDDVLFQFDFGVLKPVSQDHPGPDDTYEVNYMVDGVTQNQNMRITQDSTLIQTNLFPIKQGSIFLQKNGNFLDEDVDYAVSYLTGYIYFIDPLTAGSAINIIYTPLSRQVNDLTFKDGTSYCTSLGTLDNKLKVLGTNFQFSLFDTRQDPSAVNISRIFNDTRDGTYSLVDMSISGKVISLNPLDASNSTIGLGLTDTVLVDYTFPSTYVEYAPVVQNLLQLRQGASFFYFEGTNVSSWVYPGTVMGAKIPDSASQYFFIVSHVSYDAIGTKISLESSFSEDLINPQVFIADAPVTFLNVGHIASPITSGAFTITFPNANIIKLFRQKTLIKIRNDLYQVISVSYNISLHATVVSLTSKIVTDYTDSPTLSNITYSDVPVYSAGDTEIFPEDTIISLVKQPAFIMKNAGDRILQVTSDASNLYVDGITFSYLAYPLISDMSSAINSSRIDGIELTTYVPQWHSNKIISGQTVSVYTNSNTILNASDALWYHYDDNATIVDSTSYSISGSGTVLLTNPLQALDRYNLDYMGRRYLYDEQVHYSLRYFVTLPAKSKVVASFQYNNLDQFYVQVLDRRDFFESVTIPRMTNEAVQLNGNVGQGGQVAGDSDSQPEDGGIAGDEYRRKDAEIECRVFKDIYDFFENRIEAFGTEMDAATGIKLFNNDGYFTDTQQDAAFKSINRIFPFFDYTNMEPVKVNPITGYFFDSKAVFHQDRADVYSVGGKTRWNNNDGTGQLNSGDFIGRTDSTRRYRINQVLSDSSLILDSTFQEHTTYSRRGDKYTASTSFPLYDDDGYLGPKLIGTESGDFDLFGGNPTPNVPGIVFTGGDVFDVMLNYGHSDQTYSTYTFANPPITIPPSFSSLSLFFSPVSQYSASEIAGLLTANIPGLLVTAENVIDGSTPYGYRTALVIRADGTYNNILLGAGAAIGKLGFNDYAYGYGNRDRTDHRPEVLADSSEITDLNKEITNDLDPLLAVAYKLDRVLDPANMALATDLLTNFIPDNSRIISTWEIPLIETQIGAQSVVLAETTPPPLPAYYPTQQAQYLAYGADASAYAMTKYDASIISPNYEGKEADWAWVLDFTEHSQIVHGISSDGTAVPVMGLGDTTIAGYYTFILHHPDDSYDLRILDSTLLSYIYEPVVIYQNNGQVVPGVWTGWDTSYPVNSNYSLKNDATFTINPVAAMNIAEDPLWDYLNVQINDSLTSLGISWTSSTPFSSSIFSYTTYPTVVNIIAAINEVPGFTATPRPHNTNYVYTNLNAAGNLPVTVFSGSDSKAFSMFYTRSDMTANYYVDSTAFVICRNKDTTFISKNEFLYSTHPTLVILEAGISSVPDMNVQSLFDPSYAFGSLSDVSGMVSRVSPGTFISLPITPLFDVDFDMHGINYLTDTTALNIDWTTGSNLFGRTYVYELQSVGDIINNINNQLPSLYATGYGLDSDLAASFLLASGPISPNVDLYRGLRDCTVAYQTISDRLLVNRQDADTTRIEYLTDRTDYLNLLREPQIKSHVAAEHILRNDDGSPSDLYIWANNRFNRRQGCYSRLNQIQQQMASNQSALNVNKTLI